MKRRKRRERKKRRERSKERERGREVVMKRGGRFEEESLRKIQEWRQERDGTGQRDGE